MEILYFSWILEPNDSLLSTRIWGSYISKGKLNFRAVISFTNLHRGVKHWESNPLFSTHPEYRVFEQGGIQGKGMHPHTTLPFSAVTASTSGLHYPISVCTWPTNMRAKAIQSKRNRSTTLLSLLYTLIPKLLYSSLLHPTDMGFDTQGICTPCQIPNLPLGSV